MSDGGRPDTTRDAAGFVAMLRELKERSGLTLRGLEERAAARGEVLARSTVADMLRKDALPRPELLAAYVRACGVERPEPWLRARERLAVGLVDPNAPLPTEPPTTPSVPSVPPVEPSATPPVPSPVDPLAPPPGRPPSPPSAPPWGGSPSLPSVPLTGEPPVSPSAERPVPQPGGPPVPPFDRSPSPLSGESPAVPPVPLVPPGESPAPPSPPPSPPPSGGLLAPLSGEPPTPPRPPWRRPAVALVAFVVAAVLVRADQPNPPGTTALEQTGGSNAEPGDTGGPSAELLPVAPAGSWVTIHAADAPDLCLTEGRDGSGRYHAAVAALQPCAAPGPRVLLEPVDDEFTTIKWEHPSEKVLGCLTVLRSGPARHLLEPWDNCADDNLDQLFRVERVRDQRYRFRSAGGSACVGLRGGVVREGAEAVREPCADERDQEFTVDLRTGGG